MTLESLPKEIRRKIVKEKMIFCLIAVEKQDITPRMYPKQAVGN